MHAPPLFARQLKSGDLTINLTFNAECYMILVCLVLARFTLKPHHSHIKTTLNHIFCVLMWFYYSFIVYLS